VEKEATPAIPVAVQVEQLHVEGAVHECARLASFALESADPGADALGFASSSSAAMPHKDRKTLAKQFDFALDAWQETACACVEAGESVLVSAHTSAGKTVVAEYAIAKALRDRQRVVYTSPIKALSNQKYRDLKAKFTDVGLMTGDVSLSGNASCVIMTTEIFRSMLYRGSQLCLETACIIFDEVHYMRDRNRGVVWEEVMILLPDSVQMVFLSATIPNPRQFARWIVSLKRRPCHIISTERRPVPLQHGIIAAGQREMTVFMSYDGNFNDDTFKASMDLLEEEALAINFLRQSPQQRRVRRLSGGDLEQVVQQCIDGGQLPLIVFSFSRAECEKQLVAMKRIDITTVAEKRLITEVFDGAIKLLSDADRKLPQVESLLAILRRGVGVHHSGLLPVMREVVEILFGESLIKVLFSTETFAMGVNMPAKAVLFTSLYKWDGVEYRPLNSGEYIQMSGRAGRRGRDDHGLAITLATQRFEVDSAKAIFTGSSTELSSAFQLSFNMLLNLLRTEGTSPDAVIRQSFLYFQQSESTLELQENRARVKLELIGMEDLRNVVQAGGNFDASVTEAIAAYHSTTELLRKLQMEVRDILFVQHPEVSLPFLQPGRLVWIESDGVESWGIVVSTPRAVQVQCCSASVHGTRDVVEMTWVFDALICALVCGVAQPAHMKVMSSRTRIQRVSLQSILKISQIKANLPEGDCKSEAFKSVAGKVLEEILNHESFATSGIPYLDPGTDFGHRSELLQKVVAGIKDAELSLAANKMRHSEALPQFLEALGRKNQLQRELAAIDRQLLYAKTSALHGDLRMMRRVLQRLDFVDGAGVIKLKGRMACEIACAGCELILTEMVFRNILDGISGTGIAALCSCFILDENVEGEFPIDHRMRPSFEAMESVCKEVAVVMAECGIQDGRFAMQLRPQLIDGVLAWLSGKSFYEVSLMCNIYEGALVRVLRRLDDMMRELVTAAQVISNDELATKVQSERVKLQHGVVFAPSLYL